MADRETIALESRTVLGKKVKNLRRDGLLPATVYGKNVGPFSVQLSARTFNEVYRRVGRTTLVDLKIPGQPVVSAFIFALQRHPVTRAIIHADFRAVNLNVAMTVAVPIHITGESPLVERGDALLNQVLNAIEVSALPAELPPHIEVDISGLDSFDKSIHVRDLTAPSGATFVTSEDDLVVSLTQAREEVEEEAAVEEAEPSSEPELVRERREEDEE